MSENLNDLEMAKKRDYKIMITDEAIDKVPRVQYKDCLLYTSPSPRDRTRSRMPSSA